MFISNITLDSRRYLCSNLRKNRNNNKIINLIISILKKIKIKVYSTSISLKFMDKLKMKTILY